MKMSVISPDLSFRSVSGWPAQLKKVKEKISKASLFKMGIGTELQSALGVNSLPTYC